MKAILVIDMPECCDYCPISRSFGISGASECPAMSRKANRVNRDGRTRPDWCPLKPLLGKQDLGKQAVKELICEVKHSSIPRPSQDVLLKLIDEYLVDTNTNLERQASLKVGDKVIMNGKYYVSDENKDKIFTVISEPEELTFAIAVYLDDYKGLYPVDGLSRVEDIE